MKPARKPQRSDVSDDEWVFVPLYLPLMLKDAPQRTHSLRDCFDALRFLVKTGCQWRWLPLDFQPWEAVHRQALRWEQAKVFEEAAQDLTALWRLLEGRRETPSAAIFDGRTLQWTPESSARGGWDGAKKKKGSKVQVAVDTKGHLLALSVTAANEQERAQVAELAENVQEAVRRTVEIAWADQGYTGENAAAHAAEQGGRLEVVKHTEPKKGFVLPPRRWVVERTFDWLGRFRRLDRDYERRAKTLAAWHWVAFLPLMLQEFTVLNPQQTSVRVVHSFVLRNQI